LLLDAAYKCTYLLTFSVASLTVWYSLPDSLRDPAVESERFRRDLPDIRDISALELSPSHCTNHHLLAYLQDAVALRKIISARKNELEAASKSGTQATPLARMQRVRTRCSAAGAPVSGPGLVAEIAALPDELGDDEAQKAADPGSDSDNELLANM